MLPCRQPFTVKTDTGSFGDGGIGMQSWYFRNFYKGLRVLYDPSSKTIECVDTKKTTTVCNEIATELKGHGHYLDGFIEPRQVRPDENERLTNMALQMI